MRFSRFFDLNRRVFESSRTTAKKLNRLELHPAEQTILEQLAPRLATTTMLDLGVGGGRTTHHFAGRVRSYVGVDYSTAMIHAAGGQYPEHRFLVEDARDLSTFEDGAFDLVLFSFNGIDCVDQSGRRQVLGEVRRILKPGADFVFSTHNMLSVDAIYESKKPLARGVLRLLNGRPDKLRSRPWSLIRDGSKNFRLKLYYCNPTFQLEELAESGFEGTRVFSHARGDELIGRERIAGTRDPWLYFWCQRS